MRPSFPSLLAVLVLMAACGSTENGSAGRDRARLAAADARAFCHALVEGAIAAQAETVAVYLPVAERLIRESGFCEAVDGALAAGAIRFEAAQSAACLESLPSVARRTVGSGFATLFYPEQAFEDGTGACVRALVGLRGEGAACRSNIECSGGSFCLGDDACAEGTCTPRVAVGEPCQGWGTCVPGAECFATADGPRCLSRSLPVGAACGKTGFCEEGLYCLGSSPLLNGICQPHPSIQCTRPADCGPGRHCLGGGFYSPGLCVPALKEGERCPRTEACETWLVCGSDNLCTPSFVELGERCGIQGDGFINCYPGGDCQLEDEERMVGLCVPEQPNACQ
jgi:hypothetical protein